MRFNVCIAIVSIGVMVSAAVGFTMTDAPVLTVSQDGSVIMAEWTAVDGADGYLLVYSPYPELQPTRVLGLGPGRNFSIRLGELDSYAIAVVPYRADVTGKVSNFVVAELDPALSGGNTTVFTATSNAFSTPAPNLSPEGATRHREGDKDFGAVFVTAPAPVNSGLGPVFNHNSCESCHPKDGRDAAPGHGEKMDTMFLRLSLAGTDPRTGGAIPVPGFGTQLFTKAIFGTEPEATVTVSYEEETITLGGSGVEVSLRTPSHSVEPVSDLPGDTLFSPRVGPPVFGRGLLEAVPAHTILAMADEEDADGDGISGRVNYVWDLEHEQTVPGRFGLKANSPSLRLQAAAAYHNDIGVTSPVFVEESSTGQVQDDLLEDDPEIDEETLQDATFYIQTLGVPARRNVASPEVQRGQMVFARANCHGCHVPVLKTGDFPVAELADQVIRPYTDMLLHDMGPGLADSRPDFLATGSEWRTPPLWGIGLTKVVNGHTSFLHDGRARNLLEAIMWHGGEAEQSRLYVENLSRLELDALLAFLGSL